MSVFSLRDLSRLLRQCAGVDEAVVLSERVLDVPFGELGYDSLGLLQATGRIERDFTIVLRDEALSDAGTPRILLRMINEALAGLETLEAA